MIVGRIELAGCRKLKRLDIDRLCVFKEDAVERTAANDRPVAVLPCLELRRVAFAGDFDGAHIFWLSPFQ